MGFFDRFLNAIKLNDDFDDDDDFLDDEEEDDVDDFDEDFDDKPRQKRRFFSKFRSDDDEDDFDDYEDDEPVRPRRQTAARASATQTGRASQTSASARRTASSSAARSSGAASSSRQSSYTYQRTAGTGRSSRSTETRSSARKQQKVTPIRKRSGGAASMEVSVIRPSSMEDTREIADTLMNDCTVILNLEGLDVDIAQRVIDFTCGVCYSLKGNLQKVSGYIFILTPADVDISGDFQSILSGAFELPSMRSSY